MTVTLDAKTVNCSQLVEKLIIAASKLDKWEDSERKRELRTYGAVREWTLNCFEKDVVWSSSVVKDFQDMVGQNTKRTFVIDEGERFQANEQVYLDSVDHDLAQPKKNLRYYTLKLIEEQFTPAPNESLVLSLPFNEGQGTVAGDKSAYANDGTIYGASWGNGRYGKALSFVRSESDYVQCSNVSNLPTTAISVNAWIKITTHASWLHIVQHEWKASTGSWGLWTNSLGKIFFGIWDGSTQYTASFDGLQTGVWYHIVGTYDGNTIRIYVDNIEGTPETLPGQTLDSAGDVRIGRSEGTEYFDGMIDAVRIYSRALSQTEVESLYKSNADMHGRPLHLGDMRERDGAVSFKVDMWESQAYIRKTTNYGKIKRWRLTCFEKDVKWDDSTYRALREAAEKGTLVSLELLDDLSGRATQGYITNLRLTLYPLGSHNIRDFTIELQEQ